jgi:hypothetical protein
VQSADLTSLARSMFDPERCTLAVLGNTGGAGLDSVRLAF